ncbi:hypothetical protein [Pedobacter chitinilyticus]|uniref:hypothetical protein n=1 Tax=Pedobacter chitinilyticus TaxID=2233776 RepID=UPI000FEB7102|nr:hypothetical protein [Pedobacter chitinilyticus]
MIVNTMTLQEIYMELFKDLPSLLLRISNCKKEFRRKVLKASRFPCSASYELKTGRRKNLFILTLVAQKRGDAKLPFFNIYGIYDRPEGTYAAGLIIDDATILIYPPHFFKRYRERIVKDDKLSNKQLIHLYFTKSWMLYKVFDDGEQEELCEEFKFTMHEETSFVGVVEQGYCFGSTFGSIVVVKTIISEENIFDHKRELLHELREKYNRVKKDQGLENLISLM